MATPPVPPPGLAGLTIGLTGLGLGVATAHCLAHSSARGKPRRAFAAAGGSSGMMEAAVVERHGGPEVLKLRTVPVPMPGEGELLVRQAVCGVNFIDTHIRAGEHSSIDTRPTPFICGIEGAGTVVGAGGGGFTPGDRVVYSGTGGSPTAGAYAEYAAVPADSLVRLPSAVGFEDGCAALICGTTAHYLVHDSYPVQPGASGCCASCQLVFASLPSPCLSDAPATPRAGDWVVVHAAAGGVGRALVQMAKLRGAKVIGTCSTAAKAGAARRCGADHAVLYTGPDGETWAAAVRRLTGGGGVACVFDGVGRATFMEVRAARFSPSCCQRSISGFPIPLLQRLSRPGLHGAPAAPRAPRAIRRVIGASAAGRPRPADQIRLSHPELSYRRSLRAGRATGGGSIQVGRRRQACDGEHRASTEGGRRLPSDDRGSRHGREVAACPGPLGRTAGSSAVSALKRRGGLSLECCVFRVRRDPWRCLWSVRLKISEGFGFNLRGLRQPWLLLKIAANA